jgi:hypothetical protein
VGRAKQTTQTLTFALAFVNGEYTIKNPRVNGLGRKVLEASMSENGRDNCKRVVEEASAVKEWIRVW